MNAVKRNGEVWYQERLAGTLDESAPGEIFFSYHPDWLDGGGFPLSISLPLNNGDRPLEATSFFEGLLPEGPVRQRICRQLGVSLEDTLGLLIKIGGDCAGALSILASGADPEEDTKPPRPLDRETLIRLAQSAGQEAATLFGQQQRFSLAGAQEKQPVIYQEDMYALPDRRHPSSHILKFETVSRVCLAEYLANKVAGELGLPVVDTEFVSLQGSAPILRIRRYDRILDDSGNLQRVHQEDLLQALGMTSLFKYQREGGPSLEQIAVVLRAHTASPAIAIARLRDWQIFNCLMGNWDGHAKNLALLYPPGTSVPELAPFYDLVAIEFLNLIRPGTWSRDMAFAIGNHVQPERITRGDWEHFADQLGIPRKPTLDRLKEIAEKLPDIASEVTETSATQVKHDETLARFEESIRRRCRWTLNTVFKPVKKGSGVDPEP